MFNHRSAARRTFGQRIFEKHGGSTDVLIGNGADPSGMSE